MASISRTYTFTDGTDAVGSEVENEFDTVYTAWNNHDDGTSTFTSPKATTLDITGDAPGTPVANRLYADTIVKFWAKIEWSAGTPSITLDVNLDSITDNGTGDFTAVITTDFDTTNYAAIGLVTNAGQVVLQAEANQAVGSMRFLTINSSDVATDYDTVYLIGVGPQ